MDRRDTPQGGRRIAFNPYETGSIVPQLQEQAQRTARNNQRYKEGLDQNVEALRQTAKNQQFANRQYEQEFEQLSKFSQTLNEYFTEEANKRNQREMEEGIAAAYTDGISPEQETALERAEAQLSADNAVSQDAAGQALDQTGSYETSRRVANMSGWRAYGYSIGRAQIAGDEYGAWIATQMDGMQFGSTAEAQAAATELRMQFMRDRGLIGADVAVLNKYLFPNMRKGETRAMRAVMEGIAQDQSAMDYQSAISKFYADKDIGSLISTLSNTLASDGSRLGYARTHKQVRQILADAVKDRTLTEQQVRAMGNQVVPLAAAKGKTFAEFYPGLINGAIRDAQVARRNDDKVEREEIIRDADNAVLELYKEIIENPGEYTEGDLEKLQLEYQMRTGKPSPLLDELIKDYSTSAVQKEKDRKALQKLADEGRLKPYHLNGVAPELKKEFLPIAQGIRNASGNPRNTQKVDEALKSIRTTVAKGMDEISGDGSVGMRNGMVVQELQDMFLNKLAEYEAAMNSNPIQAAMQDVLDYYIREGGKLTPKAEGNENGRYWKGNGKDNYLDIIASEAGADRQKLQEMNELVGRLKNNTGLLKTEPVLEEEILAGFEESVMQSGGIGVQLPPMVRFLAKELNLDPYDIINDQRAVLGMPPMQSPSYEWKEEQTQKGKDLLERFQSSFRSTRAQAMAQQRNGAGFDPRIVQYGEIYQQVGAQLGMDPGLIAAMAEIESGHNPTNISYNGSSFGLMQINKAAHPGFFNSGDWKDPLRNAQYGAQYFQGLIQRYGGDLEAAAMAYNGGPGNYDAWARGERIPAAVEREMVNHGRKFMRAYSKYQRTALNSPLSMRGDFEIRQIVSTDRRYQGDNDPRTVYDPAGHGGDDMHQHYEFATVRQAELAKALYERLGYRVTSHWRPNDLDSAHSHGVAIDVAPPLDLPRTAQAEQEWVDEANAVIGIN